MQELLYKNRECYLVSEVAKELGYKRPRDFTRRVRKWLADYGCPEEADTVIGSDLHDLKTASLGSQLDLFSKLSTAVIVYPKGMWVIGLRTGKAKGFNLMNTFGEPTHSAAPKALPAHTELPVDRRVDRRVDSIPDSGTVEQLVKIAGTLNDLGIAGQVLATDVLRQTAERLLERKLETADEHGPWKMPSVIASDNNVTPDAVGRAISKLDIRGSIPGMCFCYVGMDTNDHSRDMYLYSKKATDMIVEVLNEYKKNLQKPKPVPAPARSVKVGPFARN